MPEPSLFRHYQIVQDADGSNVELARTGEQVVVLAFDTERLEFVHCHVLLEPLADRAAFEEACRKLQGQGHPLLARLADFGEDDGNPFYITGNVDGETLRAYLNRQQELPGWLALMLACRTLEAMIALCERGDWMAESALETLRVVQTGTQTVQVQVSDYGLISSTARAKSLKTPFDKPAKFLRSFFQEQSRGGPTLPDQMLPGADFTELLTACLNAAHSGALAALKELQSALQKLLPDNLSGEIPTAHKPRALLAAHLASYQEVARGVVNLVRIQSQRLDMANPYSMRGTLTKTGRTVLVEQVPPSRLAGSSVKQLDEQALRRAQKRDFSSLVPVVLVHEGDETTCLAEEMAEGISLADLLRERRSLSVHESYLVLASLDGVLQQLEKAELATRRLRLEDIFLLTGFARDDSRSAKLLHTKLNEWPAFSLMLRAHPTLAAMSGRGLDPAVLIPALPEGKTEPSPWQGAWLAALGRFLVGVVPLPGISPETPGNLRERETLARLFDDEISLHREGNPSQRADFLARYARIVQHHDLVKPVPAAASAPLVEPGGKIPIRPRTKSVSASPAPLSEPLPKAEAPLMALTSGYIPTTEKPTIGFAELLFKDANASAHAPVHDWAKTAADAPPTIHPSESLLPPGEYVPLWLRAAVFIGGSMVAGAVLAHLSGEATWQKLTPRQKTAPSAQIVPKALPYEPPTSAAPAVESPPPLPAEPVPNRGNLMPAPKSNLKETLEQAK